MAGSSRVVLARIDGRLVGLACVISDGATIADLEDVLVRPDCQRSWVRAALVRSALAPYQAVRQKVLLIDNGVAQRAFYQALGFTRPSSTPPGH